jgi:hypothetical protein
MVKNLRNLLSKSKEIKTVNYILFPTLNDKLFELYFNEIPNIRSYITRYYGIDVDQINIINDISCKYVKSGTVPVEHKADSKSSMQIIETEDGRKVALIYMMSSVEEV